jgi:hypothetical protein
MRSFISKNWRLSMALGLFIAVITLQSSTNSFAPANEDLVCSPPNAGISGRSSGSITFTWTPVAGAQTYILWYVRIDDNYQSGQYTTGNANYTFSGLPPGEYAFYFVTNCGLEMSEYLIIDDIIM